MAGTRKLIEHLYDVIGRSGSDGDAMTAVLLYESCRALIVSAHSKSDAEYQVALTAAKLQAEKRGVVTSKAGRGDRERDGDVDSIPAQ